MRGSLRFAGAPVALPLAVEKKPLALLEVDERAEGVEGALLPLPPGVGVAPEEGWKSDVFNEPDDRDDAERLFSATTLSDFSNTFHSLMVLSGYGLNDCRV